MRLIELEATFLTVVSDVRMRSVHTLKEAQGIRFLCPKCFAEDVGENVGPIGTHAIICWFADRDVPADQTPGPGRWKVGGHGLEDLTLAPSVHLSGPGCGWHGWVTKGGAK